MAITNIPTGNLPYVAVDKLPKTGEPNTIYGVLDPPNNDLDWRKDYRYHNGEWQEVDLGATIFGFLFADYQQSVDETVTELSETIANLEARVEELEGGTGLLYEDSNITLTEEGATIGKTINVNTDIRVMSGSVVHITLTDMTIDGKPIEDVSGDVELYELKDWDWQGGDLYSDVFGNGAYFSFGTKPMNAIATKVTLGFVNENGDFDVRTLAIGHIKVEVIALKGGKK